MTAKQYINMIHIYKSPMPLIEMVEGLSHEERIKLRNDLKRIGCTKLVRNLYYDYTAQEWIE
jgi:hypothetical protein